MDNNAWYQYYVPRRLAAMSPAQFAADRAAAERDVAAVLARCALQPSDRVLEIGCGWGRHRLALAQCGLRHVVSIDIDRESLAYAAHLTRAVASVGSLRCQDFREVADGPFQAVLSLYDRSVCGLPSEAEDWHSLRHLAGLLQPGGWLVFGINDWPLHVPAASLRWHATADGLERIAVLPNPAAMTCTDQLTVLRPAVRPCRYTLTRRHYHLAELQHMLWATGFIPRIAQHRLTGQPYGTGMDGLFIYAQKVHADNHCG